MVEEGERFEGFRATGCGRTRLDLALLAGGRATLVFHSQWMGDARPLDLRLELRHAPASDCYGILALTAARPWPDGSPLSLPPSDGPIVLEYVLVPPQRAREAGSDTRSLGGLWNESFSMVLWLHEGSIFDDGTDLPPDEYEVPIASFQPVARALAWLDSPWKLGRRSDDAAG